MRLAAASRHPLLVIRAVCFFLTGITLLWPGAVDAQGTDACGGRLADANWLIIECSPGFATSHDRVKIYLRDGSDSTRPWRDNLDYTNSVWIFEAGATGRATLIIDFHRDGEALVADIFDDGNGDGQVEYELRQGRGEPTVVENGGNWTVRVIARDGWWTRDGVTNFNLDILVDGPVQGMIDYLTYADLLKTDGTPELEIHVRDPDGDGRPDYEWRQAHLPMPESSGYYRTAIMVNTRGDEIPIEGSIFWPFLGSSARVGFIRSFGAKDNPAPVRVNWTTAKIVGLGEFVASRGKPGNYFIYSIYRAGPGGTEAADFENPFAFYDLAQANDGWPDLSIRVQHFPAEDPFPDIGRSYPLGALPVPIDDVQYTWDQYHRQQWDYELSVSGFYPYAKRVQFPEFSVITVPPAELPTWVTSRQWAAATFVQVENKKYFNNEHIYEWTTELATGKLWRYLLGKDIQPPEKAFYEIVQGFRGEYSLDLQSQPYLYFSPIDHKLHLLKAKAGVWNIDDHTEVRSVNLNDDKYLDKWMYLENGAVQRQLISAGDYLLYAGEGQVLLKQAQISPSLFKTLPPTNHAEWAGLRAKLDANKPSFAAGDFRTMIEQFDGREIQITGAELRDYRPISDRGFRFVLDVQSNFQVQGADLLDVRGLKPGVYAVTYDGAFRVEPLTPPNLSASLVDATLTQLEPGALRVALRNDGLEDLPQVTLELWATPPQGAATMVMTQTVTLLSQAPITPTLQWVPPSAGTWTLRPRIRWPDGRDIDFKPAQVTVQPKQADLEVVIAASTTPQVLPLNILGLITFAGIAAWIFWWQWRRFPTE